MRIGIAFRVSNESSQHRNNETLSGLERQMNDKWLECDECSAWVEVNLRGTFRLGIFIHIEMQRRSRAARRVVKFM